MEQKFYIKFSAILTRVAGSDGRIGSRSILGQISTFSRTRRLPESVRGWRNIPVGRLTQPRPPFTGESRVKRGHRRPSSAVEVIPER